MKRWWEQDQYYGLFLIAVGLGVVILRPLNTIDKWLRGEADYVLSALLLVVAMWAIVLAFYARPSLKAAALVWLMMP